MEWRSVFYNGIETNVEVTECGRVRRVKKEFTSGYKFGEIELSDLKKSKKGYHQIYVQIKGLKNRTILLHQLIGSVFLGYEFGQSKLVIDHKDCDKSNNNKNNLIIVTQRENNSKEKALKRELPIGVTFYKRDKKFRAYIGINGKNINLGSFDNPEEASQAYQNKLKSLT